MSVHAPLRAAWSAQGAAFIVLNSERELNKTDDNP